MLSVNNILYNVLVKKVCVADFVMQFIMGGVKQNLLIESHDFNQTTQNFKTSFCCEIGMKYVFYLGFIIKGAKRDLDECLRTIG